MNPIIANNKVLDDYCGGRRKIDWSLEWVGQMPLDLFVS